MNPNCNGRIAEPILASAMIALVLNVSACDSGGPDTEPLGREVTLAVSGKVTDINTNEPLSNVEVHLQVGGCDIISGECDYQTLALRLTDSNGQFAEIRWVTRCGKGFRLALDPGPDGYSSAKHGVRCTSEPQFVEMQHNRAL